MDDTLVKRSGRRYYKQRGLYDTLNRVSDDGISSDEASQRFVVAMAGADDWTRSPRGRAADGATPARI